LIQQLKAAKPVGNALPASPGAAAGRVYFTADDAKNHHEMGERVSLFVLKPLLRISKVCMQLKVS
jgi:pyruvate,orthophosphate dikinase